MIRQPDRPDYAELSDRMTYLLGLRVAFAAIVLTWSALRPEALGASFATLAWASAGYVVVAAFVEWARRHAGRFGFTMLTALLLLDGLYLAFAMYATGGTQSPIRFLAYLHLVAVSLLASYRTGLKLALWHSLLLFVVLYAQAAQLVPPVDAAAGREVVFDQMPVLNVTSFWLFALATSIFSAMNERELRQRRADLQALVDVGARLDEVGDPVHQARIVLSGIADRFGFSRGLLVGVTEGKVLILAARGAAEVPTAVVEPDAIFVKAWERREPLAVRRLDPERNQLINWALPNAQNLLIAPMMVDGLPAGAIIVEHRSRRIFGIERRVISVLGQFAAVAALNLRNAVLLQHVQDLAERDSLTGAANRHTFQTTLDRVIEAGQHATRTKQTVTAVLFIDLDDFKVVNDTLGHGAGDALLVAVTKRISGLVRQGDLVARLGGDEFAILTDDDPELPRSRAIAERLVRDLRAPFILGGESVTVTASIGIASARDLTESASDVVRNADVAMYMAKANGKAGFAIFDPGMHAAIRERHELGAQLRRAMDLDQLRLEFQPIVSLATGATAGMEALVRWQHPERGLVPPGQFIEIAEENGAILPIGHWVLQQACQRAAEWQRLGMTVPETFMCVNVSASEIQQPGFVEAVRDTLRETGFEPKGLVLEITETALLKATPPTIATLDSLRDLGVRIVIDDFGTGYFSLSHLRQFPVDALKIASEFVQDAEVDSRSSALAGAIVAMSESLHIMTVAEGIETSEQAERMRSLGCTYGQGFFFARPQSEAEVTQILRAGTSETAPPTSATGRTRRQPAEKRPAARRAAVPDLRVA
ncbi:MAG: EAL domain-containing protein [Chloroflexota bacterium]|nr:EAL domain-containing protein [Chloroflexota bacterium]